MESRSVLFVLPQLSVGGTELQTTALAIGLHARGWDVTVAAFSADGGLGRELERAGCRVVPLHRSSAGRIRTILRLRRTILDAGPDMVHAVNHAAYLTAVALVGLRVPLILSERAHPGWKPRSLKLADRLIFRRARLVIGNSLATRNALVDRHGLHPGKAVVIANGIDVDRWRPGERRGHRTRPVVICVLARLDQRKRHDLVLRALARLEAQTDVAAWFIGDGPERGRLQTLARDLRVSGVVSFLGERRDPSDLLREADIGVIASDTEGLSNALIEYMASGLPVVATRVGGNAEVVDDERTGILIPPDDPGALASALDRLIGDEQLRVRMGTEGVEQAAAFDMQAMITAHEHAYEYRSVEQGVLS